MYIAQVCICILQQWCFAAVWFSWCLDWAEWGWWWLRMRLVVALDLCSASGSCADREERWFISSEGTVAGIINGCRINLFSLFALLVWATLVAGRFFSASGAPWQLLPPNSQSFHPSLSSRLLENSHPLLAFSPNSKLFVAGGID